jgi:uncharacterized protein YkwD
VSRTKTKQRTVTLAYADSLEQQMLGLINQERNSRGLDPLQLEQRLNDSAEDYSETMLDQDFFSHTGLDGSDPGDRMERAGFVFSGSWTWGENLAWQSARGAAGYSDDVVDLHNALMNSPGHRANILRDGFELIGIGIEIGEYNGWTAVMVTQNFARTAAPVLLDTLNAELPVQNPNDSLALSAPGTLRGYEGDDTLIGSWGDDLLDGGTGDDRMMTGEGNNTVFSGDGDDSVTGGTGADKIWGSLGNDTIRSMDGQDTVGGSDGTDLIAAGAGNDRAWGGRGDDTVSGNDGNDNLAGGHGDDKLWAGAGDDFAFGSHGNDTVGGGAGDDVIWLGTGNDIAFGGSGNDAVYGVDGDDTLDGGAGNDTLNGGVDSDTYVFGPGNDVVLGFDEYDTLERVDLSGAIGITGLADLLADHLRQDGANVIIEDAAGNTMTLVSTARVDLDATDFLF